MKNKVNNVLKYFESLLLVVSGSVMLVVVTYDVINRYLFSNAFPWTHEVVKFLYIWICFIAIGHAEKSQNGGVISITYLEDKLFGTKRSLLLIIQNLITIIFYIILISAGFDVIKMAYLRKATTPTLSIPYWVMYSGFIIGISFATIRKFVKVYHIYKNLRSGKS